MNSLLNSAMMTERGQEMNASIQSISTPPTSTEGPSAPPALSETPVLPPRIISAEERLAKAMIAKAADSYAELSQYWKLKGDVIITRWQETLIPDLRTVILLPFSALSPVTENTYPEFSPHRMARDNNLLDFISARATRDPPTLAWYLDLSHSQLSRAKTVSAADLLNPQVRIALSERMMAADRCSDQSMLIIPGAAYGQMVDMNPTCIEEKRSRQRAFDRGDACDAADGLVMLEQQVVCYALALKMARRLGGGEDHVDEDLVVAYKEHVGDKIYTGRLSYSIDRVAEIAEASRDYAEDHLDFLREDAEYVSEHITDRIPATITRREAYDYCAKEEAIELLLTGYTRQTLWREVITLTDEIKILNPSLGPGKKLEPGYERKIGLLAKLVEAFVNLTYKDLSLSAEKVFSKDFELIDRQVYGVGTGEGGYRQFLESIAQLDMSDPTAHPRSTQRRRGDPLAPLFRSILALDPARMSGQTREIVACLTELTELFQVRPEQKQRLSNRLVEALGEYMSVIELREMLVESHRPHFNKERSDRSSFLRNLGSPWQQLERAWHKSIPAKLIGGIARTRDSTALTTAWSTFERAVKKQQKKTLSHVFDDLLSTNLGRHKTRFVVTTAAIEESVSDANAAQGNIGGSHGNDDHDESNESDADSDGPPPLVESSDSEPDAAPALNLRAIVASVDDAEDSDEPPPLFEVSSDEDAAATTNNFSDSDSDSSEDVDYSTEAPQFLPRPPSLRATRQASARRYASAGSSSSSSKPVRPRAPRPAHDPSKVRPDWEFGTRDGVREEEINDVGGQLKRKIKTRKERDAAMLAREEAGNIESSMGEETEEEMSPLEGHVFKVTRRVYDTFSQYLGSGLARTEVAWTDFLYAMDAIGWTPIRGAGSSWKFQPRGVLRLNASFVTHEPHPSPNQRLNQVSWVGKRLKRAYGMSMENFQIDTSRQDAAVRSAL